MTPDERRTAVTVRLQTALADPVSSVRLQTALAAGTRPHPDYVEILIARCAVEPDFSVRDTLTWALTRHPADVTVPLLLGEARSSSDQASSGQARSQALHTLSKIGDPRGWQAITDEVLRDPDDEVARSAWRAAVVLVPEGSRARVAEVLVTQLGRGGREVRRSLSRALVGLGAAADSVLTPAVEHDDEEVRRHALATRRMSSDPDESFDAAVFEATRTLALLDVPAVADGDTASPTLPEAEADR